MDRYIQIHPNDNVAVALADLPAGEVLHLSGRDVALREAIPVGHKIALADLNELDQVIKYGYPIGHVLRRVQSGEWINEQVLKTSLEGIQSYVYQPVKTELTIPADGRTFQGYRRKNGLCGIRNEIWILPTVGCVNGVANRLAERLQKETGGKGVDAIRAFPHNYGCSQLGDDHENTRKILRNMVLHPNAGGVLVVGLGCENNQPAAFREFLGDYDTERVRFLVCQEVADEEEVGMQLLREIYALAAADVRTEQPLSALRVGLKCGGSDGLSGITANPLVGRFSDYLVTQGGTTILTEVPEMFGAETMLMNRCASQDLFEKTVRLINDFKDYFIRNRQPVYENPSPGNKAGGISTLEEKSLGCTQKSGQSAVCGVLAYGEQVETHGLNLLSAPGNDLVASTALAAAGCQLVLFTTGRGTPFGTFVPTLKVSTNSRLAQQKPGWIDFNAGTLVEGEQMEDVLARFICRIQDVASGAVTRNETNGYSDIAIFKTGVTL